MSFVRDEAHPWRAASLSRIGVSVVTMPVFARAIQGEALAAAPNEQVCTASQLHEFIRSVEDGMLTTSMGVEAMHRGKLRMLYEMGDARSDGVGCIDDGLVIGSDMPYDYRNKATMLEFSSDGTHFPVQACLNAAAQEALHTAPSIDVFAKAADIKLARASTTPNAQAFPSMLRGNAYDPAAPGNMLINRMEALRSVVSQSALANDYGHRLWSLASIVAHATTLSALGIEPKATLLMASAPDSTTLLVGQLPYLTADEVNDNSWWYLGAERSAYYKAFLTMAARGLPNYVDGNSRTVYSRMHIEPEVEGNMRLIFTTRSGQVTDPQPTTADYLQVLSNPTQCLAAYYAYAASLGIGDAATAVLLQALHMPFLLQHRAVLPYYPAPPKLDAMAYILGTTETVKRLNVLSLHAVHANACLTSTRMLVGLGAGLSTFVANRFVDVQTHLAAVAAGLRSSQNTRSMLSGIASHLMRGSACLHWVNPFSVDAAEASNQAMRCFRAHGALLSTYERQPVKELAHLFTSGVNMQYAALQPSGGTAGFAEQCAVLLAAGMPLLAMCEQPSAQTLPPPGSNVWLQLRRWNCVTRVIAYKRSVGEVVTQEAPPTREPTPEPAFTHELPKGVRVPDTDTAATDLTDNTVRAATPSRQAPAAPMPAQPQRVARQRARAPSPAPSSQRVPSTEAPRERNVQRHERSKERQSQPKPRRDSSTSSLRTAAQLTQQARPRATKPPDSSMPPPSRQHAKTISSSSSSSREDGKPVAGGQVV